MKVINDKMVSTKDKDSTLTCEIKSHIKNDLEGQYTNTEINLLLDVCSFLDPRFKGNFSTDDEAVQTLIIQVEQFDLPSSLTTSQMTLEQLEIGKSTVGAGAPVSGTEQTTLNKKVKKGNSVLFLDQVYQLLQIQQRKIE